MGNVDKTIDALCTWIQKRIKEEDAAGNQDDIADMVRALADLVSARGEKNQKLIMSFQELRDMGFPRGYLERAYRSKNNNFAFKENPEKSKSTILFNIEGFEEWRQKEIKAQRMAH